MGKYSWFKLSWYTFNYHTSPKWWAIKQSRVQKLRATEMKMIKWICGHIKLGRIRSDVTIDGVREVPIKDKLREATLRLFSHIMREDINIHVRRCEKIDLRECKGDRV